MASSQGGASRAELQIDGAVRIGLELVIRRERRLIRICLDKGTSQVIVDGDGPELFDGNVCRHMQPIVLAAIEPCPGAVHGGTQVLRAGSYNRLHHPFGDRNGLKV